MKYKLAMIAGKVEHVQTYVKAFPADKEVEFNPSLQYRFVLDGYSSNSLEEAERRALMISRVLRGE